MRRPNSALSNSVTWSWKIKISSPAHPPWRRLYSAYGEPILHFTKTLRLCILSDLDIGLVVKRGCHFRAPAKRCLCLLGHADTER